MQATAPTAPTARHAVTAAATSTRSLLPVALDAVLLLSILAVHVVWQWRSRASPHWADGTDVYRAARDWPHEDTVNPSHHAMRIGSLIPVRLLVDQLGPGQVSFAAWPVACSLLLVIATYALGRQVGGPDAGRSRAVGALAAIAIVGCPFLVDTTPTPTMLTSWQLLPDVPAAAFTTTTFVLLIAGGRRRSVGWRPARDTGWLAGAGLAIGWAYLVREYMTFVFPAVVVTVLALGIPWRRWVYLVVPAAACFGLELANGVHVYGDAFARLTEAGAQGDDGGSATTRDVALRALWQSTGHLGHARGATIVALAVLTLAAPLVIRRRPAVAVTAWAVCFWVGLTLSTGVLHPATPSLRAHVLFRYWVPLLPAIFVGGIAVIAGIAAFALRVLRSLPLRTAVGSLACAALALWYVQPTYARARDASGDRQWNHLRTWLAAEQPAGILTDANTAQTLDYYRFSPVGGDVQWGSPVDTIPVPDKRDSRQRTFQPAKDHPTDDVFVLSTNAISPWNAAPGRGWAVAWERDDLCVLVAVDSDLGHRLGLSESQTGCRRFAQGGSATGR